MGKIPPSLRATKLPVSTFKNPLSVQQQAPSSTPSPKPHYPFKQNKPFKPRMDASPETQSPIAFKSSNLSDAKILFNSFISTRKIGHFEVKFYNSILSSYSSISSLQDSICFLNHMIKTQPSFAPDRSTYHVLLTQSCESTDTPLSSVHQIFNLMNSNGFPPNEASTDIAVRLLCASGREEDATDLVKELSSKGFPPDTYTYNFLVRQLCRNRSLSMLYSFINEMRDGFDIKPDLVSYTIMIDNVCNHENLREATRLLRVLSEEGYKPDSYVYNTIMKGYCSLSQASEILGVYNKMLDEGVKPDHVTFNTLIYGLSKSGRVKEAKKFLGVMTEMGLFPDAVAYTSLMNGMCRERDISGAFHLLEEMEETGCSPNSCTYNTLLHGLCEAKLMDKAIELYGQMKNAGMKLDSGCYGKFLRYLCRCGMVAEAYEVFDYAVESKSLTDVAAYSTLESNMKWLKKAREQGLAA